ncbi:hypothetical protein Emed_004612 [Eimeria media]
MRDAFRSRGRGRGGAGPWRGAAAGQRPPIPDPAQQMWKGGSGLVPGPGEPRHFNPREARARPEREAEPPHGPLPLHNPAPHRRRQQLPAIRRDRAAPYEQRPVLGAPPPGAPGAPPPGVRGGAPLRGMNEAPCGGVEAVGEPACCAAPAMPVCSGPPVCGSFYADQLIDYRTGKICPRRFCIAYNEVCKLLKLNAAPAAPAVVGPPVFSPLVTSGGGVGVAAVDRETTPLQGQRLNGTTVPERISFEADEISEVSQVEEGEVDEEGPGLQAHPSPTPAAGPESGKATTPQEPSCAVVGAPNTAEAPAAVAAEPAQFTASVPQLQQQVASVSGVRRDPRLAARARAEASGQKQVQSEPSPESQQPESAQPSANEAQQPYTTKRWNPADLPPALQREPLLSGKLPLLLDLDNTLLHAQAVGVAGYHIVLEDWLDEDGLPEVYKFELPCNRKVYYLKLRPGLRRFLKALARVFELSIYTNATQEYADLVVAILDPDRSLFGDRSSLCMGKHPSVCTMSGPRHVGVISRYISLSFVPLVRGPSALLTVRLNDAGGFSKQPQAADALYQTHLCRPLYYVLGIQRKSTGRAISSPADARAMLWWAAATPASWWYITGGSAHMPHTAGATAAMLRDYSLIVARESSGRGEQSENKTVRCLYGDLDRRCVVAFDDRQNIWTDLPVAHVVKAQHYDFFDSSRPELLAYYPHLPVEETMAAAVENPRQRATALEKASPVPATKRHLTRPYDWDRHMQHMVDIFIKVHQEFFKDPWNANVGSIISGFQSRALAGVGLFLTGYRKSFAPGSLVADCEERQAELAQRLGATVHRRFDEPGVTHVMAGKSNTNNMLALKERSFQHLKKVHTLWLFSCESIWAKAPESCFDADALCALYDNQPPCAPFKDHWMHLAEFSPPPLAAPAQPLPSRDRLPVKEFLGTGPYSDGATLISPFEETIFLWRPEKQPVRQLYAKVASQLPPAIPADAPKQQQLLSTLQQGQQIAHESSKANEPTRGDRQDAEVMPFCNYQAYAV